MKRGRAGATKRGKKTKPSGSSERPTKREIRAVNSRLRKKYGARPWTVVEQPILDSLVRTILSQATNDVNSARAFASLKEGIPDWDQARRAPVRSIESKIRSGGLAKMKARSIKDILQDIHKRHGATSLEHLRKASTEEIKEELGRLPRIGPKTIACVLMFTLKRPDFPVDTHVHRISRRLGWVPEKASAVATYETLNAIIPDELTYELHVLLIAHGRRCCRSQRPTCETCPIRKYCDFGKSSHAQS